MLAIFSRFCAASMLLICIFVYFCRIARQASVGYSQQLDVVKASCSSIWLNFIRFPRRSLNITVNAMLCTGHQHLSLWRKWMTNACFVLSADAAWAAFWCFLFVLSTSILHVVCVLLVVVVWPTFYCRSTNQFSAVAAIGLITQKTTKYEEIRQKNCSPTVTVFCRVAHCLLGNWMEARNPHALLRDW